MGGTHDVRERLLDSAIALIERGGPAAATPAAVADHAGAAKMSIYRHFEGKDELVTAALDEREPKVRASLLGGPSTDARERVLEIFDRLADNADADPASITSCPYVATELSMTAPNPAIHRTVIGHKDAMRAELSATLSELGVADTRQVADALLMLLDGAVVHAQIRRSGAPLRVARAAAAVYLDALSSQIR